MPAAIVGKITDYQDLNDDDPYFYFVATKKFLHAKPEGARRFIAIKAGLAFRPICKLSGEYREQAGDITCVVRLPVLGFSLGNCVLVILAHDRTSAGTRGEEK